MVKINVKIEEKYFETLYKLADRMYELKDIILKNRNSYDKIDNLLALLEECIKINSNEFDELDGPIYSIIDNIAIEIKKLPQNKQKQIKDKFFKLLEEYNEWLRIFNEKGEVTGWY
jgi:mRNA-degrading endonuclease RelE of RelBE toxin-antitoxin system